MIEIERLELRLPAEFGARAESIGRAVALELAPLEALGPLRIGGLAPPPVRVGAGATDAEVARSVARAVVEAVRAGRGRPW